VFEDLALAAFGNRIPVVTAADIPRHHRRGGVDELAHRRNQRDGGDEVFEGGPAAGPAEGAGRAPAYRGLAYLVFEDLALAAFGNRIPVVTSSPR
jgi:hypothetical protein